MSDLNANTRVVGSKRVPSIVVHKVTGERLLRAPIDCRELIALGEWEWASDAAPVAPAPPDPVVEAPLPEPVPVPEPNPEPVAESPRRGRPRKN